MPPEVFPTTAENVISATDAVLAYPGGCGEANAAEFMETPVDSARYALQMAAQLGLVEQDAAGLYRSRAPLAVYLVTAESQQKAAVMRLVIENYEPYRIFKHRLALAGNGATAAMQVKVVCHLNHHRDEIRDTLVSLGTYSQSLISKGAGIFEAVGSDTLHADFLCEIASVAADRAKTESQVREHLGEETYEWIEKDEVFDPLVTAHQLLNQMLDHRGPVVHAGNAVESFLIQIGAHHGVNLNNATGINAKVDTLGTKILKKHKHMLKYLGHVRNASDHGIDLEIGCSWNISSESATEYVHLAMSTIRSVVLALAVSRYEI